MKICPNCQAEVENNFNLCWNCNYSFTENKIVEIFEEKAGTREIDCLRCKLPMRFAGNYDFHEGPNLAVLGSLFEAFVNRESFDLYLCPRCGKVEFFSPK
jgi:Zn finger protein HypA/HybF involved in hydrogenase expression